MKKQNKSPLGWFFDEPKDDDQIIGYYIGNSESGSITEGYTYSFSVDWTPTSSFFATAGSTDSGRYGWIGLGDGGKKTLHVTKKDDIKFV